MNLNRTIRLLLLMLFALLQCAVPFAHAHVNGQHASKSVHIATIDPHFASEHEAVGTHLSVEALHSAVVCVPPAYRFDVQAIAQIIVVLQAVPAVCVSRVLPLRSVEQQVLPHLPYQHPFSQAPPA